MNPNILNTNGSNDPKSVPFKAYLLNKYEHLKEPSVVVLNTEFQSQAKTNLYPAEMSDFPGGMYTMKSSAMTSKLPADTSSKSLAMKMTNPSPSSANKLHFSGSNSSLVNSDDEDEYGEPGSASNYDADRSREEKRRISHTAAEQKRRNAIKQGYELIQSVVPSCQQTDPIISMRITRAITLEQTIDYIHEMEKESDNHETELDSLKKEIMALKIMKSNYEEILQFHRNQPKDNSVEINDDALFDLFVKFSDNLFQSFQSMISGNSFGEMTSSTLNWLEQMCTTNNLKNLVLLSLYQVVK